MPDLDWLMYKEIKDCGNIFMFNFLFCYKTEQVRTYRVIKKEGGKVKGYYTTKKLILGAV